MQKYVLVTFLEPIAEGTEFTVGNWPLHTTLVSNFVVDLEDKQLVEKLAQLFTQQKSISTVGMQDTHFGPQGQVHVTLLDLVPELASLHHRTVELLKANDAVFDEPQYLEEGFKPHATVQQNGRVNEGDLVAITAVSLVDMFPGGDIRGRKVMQTFTFSEPAKTSEQRS